MHEAGLGWLLESRVFTGCPRLCRQRSAGTFSGGKVEGEVVATRYAQREGQEYAGCAPFRGGLLTACAACLSLVLERWGALSLQKHHGGF